MQVRPHRIINRKKTREIKVGNISVGGGSPISVQSMTNTITSDVKSTVKQILSLEEANEKDGGEGAILIKLRNL